jgi:hypothetical protein
MESGLEGCTRTPQAAHSPPHMCPGIALGVYLVVWRLMAEAEQLWAVCLETAVSVLSHDFCVA